MGYVFEMEELMMLLPGLVSGIPTGLFGIAAYILTALAVYRIADRRGLNHPWLAWIPVANVWLLGSISDQYQYVVKGEIKSKRKWMLVLSILQSILVTLLLVLCIVTVSSLIISEPSEAIGPVVAALGLVLPLAGVAIALYVIRYMALYDVYRSLDPGNAVLYLVLSILFSTTEPFFLFFNREKELGMPPRRQQPVYTQDYTYETPETTYETVVDTEYR